ncbi:Type III restriction enzyme, res subunit [Candidatus Filomicrobium marinum]|uniref:Type III restriction enzyme, res subunit n=1 Tax=Candidatus Filomicrobium marinum TaxID=1608628 RepID=A0A0D6JE26_9HYPH|nr:DEAD/DEAH box helicase family protein [Candidatus Filomicrobium marinum]CFX18355.1 Type III restriction enzyme, res subunit [Candidatus Filomicrobium marinum]CPR18360.1 Type III restriction enzyme, res subunit [Candidatus Filomicrobium marinum]
MTETAADNSISINAAALDPLFAPWEEPNKHRVRAKKGQPPETKTYRRQSPIRMVNPLRAAVKEWRELNYFGASDTTRELLGYWFERPHRLIGGNGEEFDFRYYFCQREAIETFIYLIEIRGLTSLSSLIFEYGGPNAETEALGIKPEDDEWARYAFKLATGAGKTKCMSLAVVWSYFHALRESGSEMAKHFVIIAPNLTVFERLKEDFRPEGGGPDIFMTDPLIPPEWRGDWNFSVVLQDEASGASTGGVLYLTNIHRLFEPRKGSRSEAETYDWAGPAVSKSKALDTGAELRDRITSHPRLMVFNDEAHHVWDPGSAWSEAIRWLHETVRKRSGNGLVAQLDFSATPKDNKGRIFPHVVCDTPLGEAVDAGIVKTPIIGRTKELVEQAHDDAAYQYEAHLRLGYERWKRSRAEWEKSGKKPLLFVMCTDTEAANQITDRLNADSLFSELNGKTINLHTNLKGKVKKRNIGGQTIEVFEESEKDISDEDLKAIRRSSRELDRSDSPYRCIVSVLMLREGWDVRNVTTIVPLRPYSSKANILPEQTLGRGLRRMTPPGQANELVTVVEHPAFSSLYEQELEQEGLPIEVLDTEKVPATTVTIFPDETKDLTALDIMLPALSAAHEIQPKLEGLTIQDVKAAFEKYSPLPLGNKGAVDVKYEGRHLITDEVIEVMNINLPLLHNGLTAISFYVRELEAACKVQSTHKVLAPLLGTFLSEILFNEKVALTDDRLKSRLADQDVREHIRATFIPLIRARTVKTEKRRADGLGMQLRNWKPYQATLSERKPVERAKHTLFNLVPCDQSLEVAMTSFLDNCSDVTAFAKNAGPQALRIDYLTADQRLAFYRPDFFVRMDTDEYAVVETKGRQDSDVPRKAAAAIEWCKAASKGAVKWHYIFTPQNVMERLTGNKFADLARACAPALQNLLSEATTQPELPLFGPRPDNDAEEFYGKEVFDSLPVRARKAAADALELYRFFEKKTEAPNFAPVFQALLGSFDEACKAMIVTRLQSSMPATAVEQRDWFEPYMPSMEKGKLGHLNNMAKNLKRGLVYGNPHSVIGLLRSCLDFALNDTTKIDGVFKEVNTTFRFEGSRALFEKISAVNEFRNTYVAHSQKELRDAKLAEQNLKSWIVALSIVASR